MKFKKEKREMKREIINPKYKILMRKPRMVVAVRKKKRVKSRCDNKDRQENDNVLLYKDLQNLECLGKQRPRDALP